MLQLIRMLVSNQKWIKPQIELVQKLLTCRDNTTFFSLRSKSLRRHMIKQVLISLKKNLKLVIKLLQLSKLIPLQVQLPIQQQLYHSRLITTVLHHTLSFNRLSTLAELRDSLAQTKQAVKINMIKEVLS